MPTHILAAALIGAVVAGSCSSSSKRSTSATSTTSGTPTSATSAGKATTASSSSVAPSAGSANWTTYFHDGGRSGVASDGPVAPAAVRRQWVSPTLDGDIYAQPLVLGERVIVATENDTVYALNAGSGAVVWSKHLGTPVSAKSLPCGDVDPVGITSTPVVDVGAARVYAVAMMEPARDTLFALDLGTGSVVASTGVDAPGADPATHNQRGALALAGGDVLVPFGGRYGDCGTYHGRLASVPVAATGFGSPSWYSLPSGREGGFWSPSGPVIAADGTIFLTSGNTASSTSYDFGNTVVHLSGALKLLDSFAPANWVALNSADSDLGSTNPALIGGNRIFQVGKGGVGYLLDAGHLGGIGGQLSSATVCSNEAMGGVSRNGDTVFVPCRDGVAGVSLAGDRVTVKWRSTAAAPGPAIVSSGAVWTVATGAGGLLALDLSTGRKIWSQPIGAVPSEFTSPAAGGGRVVVAADRKVMGFGD